MFNLDGSEAMMCGNGIRCFAKFIYDHKLSDKHVLKIETKFYQIDDFFSIQK